MFILTHSNLYPSARALRNKIEELSRNHLYIATGIDEISNLSKRVIGIRWGNSNPVPSNVMDFELNSPSLIRTFSNKQSFSSTFKEEFWTPEFHKEQPDSTVFPVLIRTTLNGFGGVGIIPCKTFEDFKKNWMGNGFWTPYYNLDSEFRVHVIDGEVVRIFRKIKDNEVSEQGEFNIRNSRLGWHFGLTGSDPNKFESLRKLSTLFWESVKGKFNIKHGFYGLDVGWSKKNQRYFVLEGNTAPSLASNENTLSAYANKFVEILDL